MRWHFLLSEPADGATNMALDEALMRRASRTGDAVFRVYSWSSPTLSLGRNQRAAGCYDETAAASLRIGFVRRPTGGRALLHHHEVTYSATLSSADSHSAREAYDFINEVLLSGLNALGVSVAKATNGVSVPPGLRPCFDVPAERELVISDRKLVGSAQWRHEGALLQHGSILVRDDQALINRVLRDPLPDVRAAATLSEALGFAPSISDVADALRHALEQRTGGQSTDFDVDEMQAETALLRRAYEDASWTWRR
jgi:lipoate-protein ligase A